MAKKLANLIRIHEWRVDERRRKLGDLLRLLDDLEEQARRLEDDLVREQRIAAKAPAEAGFLYGGYAQAVIARREVLRASIAKAEAAIVEAREDLAEAYRELKKYQIAQEARDRAEARETARRETIVLDEIGLQGYARHKA